MEQEKPKISFNPPNFEKNEIKGLNGTIHYSVELESRQIDFFINSIPTTAAHAFY